MSEDDARPVAPAAAAPSSFGARLAAARESGGLTVSEIAARLRLHPNQVRALDEENFGALPEAAYVRGFVRSYARIVGIDPAPLLDDLNAKLAKPASSVVDGMARTDDYSPVRAAAREQASRTVVLGIAVVALIALGAIGWYATQQPNETAAAANNAAAPPVRSEPAPPAQPTAAAAPLQAPAETVTPSEPAAPPASAPAEAPSAPPPLLALQFGGVSWVEVTDAKGNVLLSQLAQAGERYQLSGALPLAVVIGDASKASVAVRGEPMDLDSIARSNVARFTVR
jgi:cytoskeleton protein RodZ